MAGKWQSQDISTRRLLPGIPCHTTRESPFSGVYQKLIIKILSVGKEWIQHPPRVFSDFCRRLYQRQLYMESKTLSSWVPMMLLLYLTSEKTSSLRECLWHFSTLRPQHLVYAQADLPCTLSLWQAEVLIVRRCEILILSLEILVNASSCPEVQSVFAGTKILETP